MDKPAQGKYMKILYLHPHAWSGEYPILKKLRDLGHEICVLEEDRIKSSPAYHITDYFHEHGDSIATLWYNPKKGWKKIITWPVDRFFKRAFNGRNLGHRMWVIWDAVSYFKPDAVISSEGFAYAIPAAFLKQTGLLKPALLISYIGGDILDCPEADVGKRRTALVTWLMRQPIKSADILRPVSPMLKYQLIDLGANPDKIHVVPSHLVISTENLHNVLLQKKEIRLKIRQRYRIPENAPLIITLSSNLKGKGLHVLASAWPEVLKHIPDCRWILCGPDDPWLKQGVLPLLRNHAVENTVFMAGKLSGLEVFEYLIAADVHINPVLCEGLNMVTVEAAAVGTPTITSDGAGIASWVEEFEAGKVVPAGDATALTWAIVDFFQKPHIAETWGQHCARLSENFIMENVASSIINLLHQALPR